jgi:hypothetical protein
MSLRRIGAWILVVIVTMVIVFYVKGQRRTDFEAQAKSLSMTLLSEADNYKANEKYYGVRAEAAHKVAFGSAFDVGGRRQAASFDENRYLSVFFERLIDIVQNEGRQDIAKDLIKLRDSKNIARPAKP